MPKTPSSDISDALAAPLGDLIAAVGRGLADAQRSLDMSTIETIKALHAGDDENLHLLRRLGYQPTWYRIPELSAEMTVSLTIAGATVTRGIAEEQAAAPSGPGRIRLYVAPMDASYTNRYDFDLQAASVIKFRVVPVPPTTQAAELKVVPRLTHMPFKDAGALLAEMGIPFETSAASPGEQQPVAGTEPEAGEFLRPGAKVLLKF